LRTQFFTFWEFIVNKISIFKQAALVVALVPCAIGAMAQTAQGSADSKGSFTATVTMRDISGIKCTDLSFGTIFRIPLTLFAATDSVTIANTSDTAPATTSAVGATVTGGHPAVCTVTGLKAATPAQALATLSSASVLLVNVANVAQSLSAVLTPSLIDSGAAAGTSGKFRIGGTLTLKTAGPAAGEAADGVYTSSPITITVTN
jgi:hypothetical protein